MTQWPTNNQDPYRQAPTQWGPPQGNAWGQQQSWGQPSPFQPRQVQAPRRRHPVLRFLRAMLLLTVLGFAGLIALGAWASHQTTSGSTGGSSSAPATSQTGGTQPTTQATQPTGTESATTQPGADQSAATQASSPASAPAGTYQNDSYVVPAPDPNPPALPEPETYTEATQLLKSNPLYSQSVPRPVRCEMGPLDLENATKAQLTTHLNQMMGCLMRVWSEPLSKAGFEAVRPTVTVYTGSVSTKCGKMESMNAAYCGADQQVYYADDLPAVVPRSLRSSRFITESVIAHEFGHAVQARSAILISEQAWEEKSTKTVALDLSRRLEQQADCFAGEFLGSVQQSTQMTPDELSNISKLFYSIGDDVLSGQPGYVGNHGWGKDRQAWITTGLNNTRISACDTFVAPASTVR